MQRFYSQSTGSTYLDGIHREMPNDAVPISEHRYLDVIANPPSGKIRSHDESGLPILLDLPPAPPSVPQSITMRQARLCLHKRGLLAGVQPAIDALPEPDRTAAQIEWDYSSVVERHRGFVLTIAESLGLTDEQLDELFIEAATL